MTAVFFDIGCVVFSPEMIIGPDFELYPVDDPFVDVSNLSVYQVGYHVFDFDNRIVEYDMIVLYGKDGYEKLRAGIKVPQRSSTDQMWKLKNSNTNDQTTHVKTMTFNGQPTKVTITFGQIHIWSKPYLTIYGDFPSVEGLDQFHVGEWCFNFESRRVDLKYPDRLPTQQTMIAGNRVIYRDVKNDRYVYTFDGVEVHCKNNKVYMCT